MVTAFSLVYYLRTYVVGQENGREGKTVSTTAKNKRVAARERIAAQRRASQRRQRRARLLIAGGSITAVLAIVISLVLVKALSPAARPGPAAATGTALPASVVAGVTSVPPATLNTVGTGTAASGTVTPVAGAPLRSGGKPEILYIGTQYCPYCATERWPLTVALSRFGTFSGLHGIHSSATDVYPSQPTLTYYGSTYRSRYLAFAPVETTTVNADTPLQRPTAAEQAVLSQYDAPPYVPAADTGSIPFIDIGGRYLIHGAQYDPQVLQGLTWAQVAAALRDPSSPVARGVDGAANMITAAICKLTGNQPASVCTSPAMTSVGGHS
jgi:hypothetical protein